MSTKFVAAGSLAALIAATAVSCGAAQAEPLTDPLFAFVAPPQPRAMAPQYPIEQFPMQDAAPVENEGAQLDPRLRRQIVGYPSKEAPGTIVVDTPNTYLYYVLGDGQAIRYGIGVGREGFTWSGVKQIARKAEWPDWYPPQEMIARQPYLPRMTAGGPGNPLGARALYIGGTQYRIHGTNDPTTIGKNVSSGCIRLTNEDVEDLYARVQIGAKVVVLPQANPPAVAQRQAQAPQAQAQQAQAPQRMPVISSHASGGDRPSRMTWNAIRPSGLY